MMICGSCGMRMDGAAVLACKTRMYEIARSGHVPVVSAMGNLPIVKDLVVDMDPFWAKFKAMKPFLQPGYDQPEDGREHVISQERMNVIHKESLCINCGCCVSECNAMESDPEFLGPQALAKGMRFVGDPRDAAKVERLDEYSTEHGIWECTRCYFCNERCPKGVDPRDAIAKLGAEAMKEGIDDDMGAKHAKWFVTSAKTTGWLRETELVPKTQGIVSSIKEMKFAMGLPKHGKVPLPFPPHVAEGVKESRALYDLVKQQDRQGAQGSSRANTRSGASSTCRQDEELPVEKGSRYDAEGRKLRKVAYYKGCLASLSAKELDISTQALSPKVGLELIELETVTCCGAGDIHEAEPDYYLHLNARILAYSEATGCDTLMTVCNVCTLNLRQANYQLQGDAALLERVNDNLAKVGVPEYKGTVDVQHFLWLVAAGEGYELLQTAAHKGLKGLKVAPFYGCQILRPSKLLGFEDPDQPVVARADHRGVRRRGDRLPREDQVLRLPDHPGPRGDRARRADPADRAGEGGRRRRDRDAVPALPPLPRRLADEAEETDRQGLPDADPAPLAADRRRRRARGGGAEVQAPRRLGAARARETERLIARFRPLRRLHEVEGRFRGRRSWGAPALNTSRAPGRAAPGRAEPGLRRPRASERTRLSGSVLPHCPLRPRTPSRAPGTREGRR